MKIVRAALALALFALTSGAAAPARMALAAVQAGTGSFRTSLGTITAVDAARGEITITQLADKKPLTVVVRPDSVLKQVPAEMSAMMGGGPGGPGGAPGGGAAPQGGERRVIVQGGPGAGGPGGPGGQAGPGGPGGGPAGGPVRRMVDPQRMLETLPAVTLAELKPG